MANKYFNGTVVNKKIIEDVDNDLISAINKLDEKVENKMNNLEIGYALDEIFNVLRRSNKYIDETMPWVLAKDETKQDRLQTVLYNLLESIRVCANMLNPFLTITSEEILKQINASDKSLSHNEENTYTNMVPTVLFQRIDKDKKLEEIENINV